MKKSIIVLVAVAAAFAMVSCDKGETGQDAIGGIMINGHEAVNMGDGLFWATCNIGAESETDYGSYFSWGETSEKTNYSRKNYKYGNIDPKTPDDYGMEKYNTQDNLTRLQSEDDAATTLWGESWRTPTSAEIQRLLNPELYDVKWTSKKGKDGKEIQGLEITSKRNNNSIFLPAAGRYVDRDTFFQGEMIYYWSSSLSRDDSGDDAINFERKEVYFADYLTLKEDEACVLQQFRFLGFPIRAVAN